MSGSGWPPVRFTSVSRLEGPLLVVEGVSEVGWDEFVIVECGSGPPRRGAVLEIDGERALVEVFEGTDDLTLEGTRVAFTGSALEIPVGPGWLGRVCGGRGEPLDGGPPVTGPRRAPVGGAPINPVRRARPSQPVLTGVSAIDLATTLVRGQKLPLFSPPGAPHLRLATQIAAQARAADETFCVVFAGLGLTHPEIDEVRAGLEERVGAGELCLVLNAADDPALDRLLTPRIALTVAEDLAFVQDRHVLVVMGDMTSYAESLREVSAARGDMPTRRAYPGNLYSDLASLYERCGRLQDRPGSLTMVPFLSMPAGDITHPVPDLTGYITEGQVVLSAESHARGIYPPIDLLSSLSRLMGHGAGTGHTRDDHLELAAAILAGTARSRRVALLAEMVGDDAVGERDRPYLDLGGWVERDLVAQRADEARTLEDTLDRGWRVLGRLPRPELATLPQAMVAAHLGDAASCRG